MRVIKTGLPETGAPLSWAVEREGILYTAQVPIHPDGSIETGAFQKQARLVMDNLAMTLEAAGGGLSDLAQVIIYLTDASDVATMNAVYADYIAPPYPNRATLIIKALAIPGARVEIVAHAHIPREPAAARA